MKNIFLLIILLFCHNLVAADSKNLSSLQHGAQIFMEHCAGCHSLQYVSYTKMIEDLRFRQPKFALYAVDDVFIPALTKKDAEHWFGIAPPDLSLIARLRGKDWLQAYLTGFYMDDYLPFGVNNLVLPNVRMPHVLSPLQGHVQLQVKNNKKQLIVVTPGALCIDEYEKTITDLVDFLAYTSEPAQLIRYHIGWLVMSFISVILLLFIVLTTFCRRNVL